MPNTVETLASQRLLDVLIRAGVITVLAIFCYGVFRPFLNLVLWSLILAITLYPAHLWLRSKVGSDGRAATLLDTDRHRAHDRPRLFPRNVAGGVGGASGGRRQKRRVSHSTAAGIGRRLATDRGTPAFRLAVGLHRSDGPRPEVGTRIEGRRHDRARHARGGRRRFSGVHFGADHRRRVHGLRRDRKQRRGAHSHAPHRTGAWTDDRRTVHRHRSRGGAGRGRHRVHSGTAARRRLSWSKVCPVQGCWRWRRCCSASCSCLSC